MEIIRKEDEITNLKNNKLIGNPKLNNSTITFNGDNNILFCEDNLELINSNISFNGNNSIIYLSYGKYPILLFVKSNSTIFIGRNNKIISKVIINIQENQNFIMGDECILGSGVIIRPSDGFPIYDLENKQRINFTESIFIGDHVWLDYSSYISGGVKIGSGAIIGKKSFVPPYTTIPSNTQVLGNPCKIINKNVFFTNEYVGNYTHNETKTTSTYKSNVYCYNYVPNETLFLTKINQILNQLSIDDRLEFIIKLFVKNKHKNRFTITTN